jgi:transposase
MVRVIEDLAGDWRRLDERIEGLSGEIAAIARQDSGCERLMSVPGIGPIISSAMVAAIANARCQLVHQRGSRNRERAEPRRTGDSRARQD